MAHQHSPRPSSARTGKSYYACGNKKKKKNSFPFSGFDTRPRKRKKRVRGFEKRGRVLVCRDLRTCCLFSYGLVGGVSMLWAHRQGNTVAGTRLPSVQRKRAVPGSSRLVRVAQPSRTRSRSDLDGWIAEQACHEQEAMRTVKTQRRRKERNKETKKGKKKSVVGFHRKKK